MSQILIDRELLQRILDIHFELEAASRAYLGVQQKAQLKTSGQPIIHHYVNEVKAEKVKVLSETQGLRSALRNMVQTKDDAAFLAELVPKFYPNR